MKVKGIAVAIVPDFVRSKFGPEGLAPWLAALPDESRRIFEGHLLVSRWYPMDEAYHRPTEVLCQRFYDGDPRGAWELGRYSADYVLKGVYKAFIKSPVVTVNIGHAGFMLPTYFQPATIEVASLEEQRGVLRITCFEGSTRYSEQRIGGWLERALELAGVKGARVEIAKSLAGGDQYTEYLLAWAN